MSAKLRSGPESTMSVGGRITPDSPSSTGSSARCQATIPPSSTATRWYPNSFRVAPARVAFRPSRLVTAIGVSLEGTRSPIWHSSQPRGTQRAPGTWPLAKSWLVSTHKDHWGLRSLQLLR